MLSPSDLFGTFVHSWTSEEGREAAVLPQLACQSKLVTDAQKVEALRKRSHRGFHLERIVQTPRYAGRLATAPERLAFFHYCALGGRRGGRFARLAVSVELFDALRAVRRECVIT